MDKPRDFSGSKNEFYPSLSIKYAFQMYFWKQSDYSAEDYMEC